MESTRIAIDYSNKEKFYKELLSEVTGVLEPEWFVNLANISALLNQHLPQINWVGFYLNHNGELLLSSFQGLPACTRIAFGKGVCGTAAATQTTQLVADVDQFPGHIVCDSASKSEIVIPMIKDGKVLGVLDIDAPVLNRFDHVDQKYLEQVVALILSKSIWPNSLI
ncbi:guanylate cyclase [Bdellovibrio bacteriovorus]|uniref:Guanylate cyclase n=1 Tax=Bdellovibrio bacteriovorus TaxID=959 RepID=A0A150WPA1_BDEBC|nr:GAF domain-containing protein [Bdellovibrio bacteriovorus]KYG66312.1 guanylate cyclase [Bdellovibrio bacteriovorus]